METFSSSELQVFPWPCMLRELSTIVSPRHTLTNPHLLASCALFVSSLPSPAFSKCLGMAGHPQSMANVPMLWNLQEPGFTDCLMSFLFLRSLPTLRLLVLFAAICISYSNVFHVRHNILTVLVTVPLTLHFVTLLCILFSHQHTAHWFLLPSQSEFSELKLAKQPRSPSIKGHLSILVFFCSEGQFSCYYFYLTRGLIFPLFL